MNTPEDPKPWTTDPISSSNFAAKSDSEAAAKKLSSELGSGTKPVMEACGFRV